jgi:hypothetical protein
VLDIVAEKTLMLLDDTANVVHSPRRPDILVLQHDLLFNSAVQQTTFAAQSY